ncbi:hypothetical protein Rta_11760 [Ramlibacter tataouinensis TTB310]|uniref:Uncharacterized protein n=1 Tax=Ramlibacter tataouinensis (strain ATCC BAA-407 / DSM 14655 / LMG 21543 / TTB310) TaxID=365046 RepID=F5Y1L1_RAMTT|nr:hypothetical protein Rta_11760 [Ramlibacter tataouinensis TTB310]
MRRSHQLLQDAAGVARMVGVAERLQGHQLVLQRLQALQPGAHPRQLGLHQRVHVVALAVQRLQQPLDVGQRHVQRPAVAHEGQPLQLGRAVVAVAVGLARGLGQQAGFLVIADGVHVHAGGAGQVTDLHGAMLAA